MINYVKGDATFPEKITPDKNCLIVHIVNDIGAWGKGFVLSLSKRWTQPEYAYKTGWKVRKLGEFQIIQVEKNIAVINLFAQHGIKKQNSNYIPIRYEFLYSGLLKLKSLLSNRKDIAIHMPKIGCGLAGGDWDTVSKIIDKSLSEFDIYVYEL